MHAAPAIQVTAAEQHSCCMQGLKNENVAVRRGSALALGALPSLLLLPYAAEVLLSLGCSAQVWLHSSAICLM